MPSKLIHKQELTDTNMPRDRTRAKSSEAYGGGIPCIASKQYFEMLRAAKLTARVAEKAG
jgi:hypothetical protein